MLATTGFHYAMQATSSNEFCAQCHADNATKEWRESAHYRNSHGFVAGCADCHLPEAFLPRVARKLRGATFEVWGQLAGVLDTPEKYEARRLEMAQTEWRRLRSDGAQECRGCHRTASMAEKSVADMHGAALSGGATCTDCHQGVAHRAPAGSKQP